MVKLMLGLFLSLGLLAQDTKQESVQEVNRAGKLFTLSLSPNGSKTFVIVKLAGEDKAQLSLKDFRLQATTLHGEDPRNIPILKDLEQQLYYFHNDDYRKIHFLIKHGALTEKVEVLLP